LAAIVVFHYLSQKYILFGIILIMIPFYKAFSLFIRVLSKPVLNYAKRVHSSQEMHSSSVRVFFIYMGNLYHRYDSMINRKFLKIKSHFAHKPLNDELAL